MATVFPIPHAGGASTHVELLVSLLRRERIFGKLIRGNDLHQSPCRKLGFILARVVNSDFAKTRLLEHSRNAMAKLMSMERGARDSEDFIIHCHDPLATCAALRSGIRASAVIQTVHGPWSKETRMRGFSTESLFYRSVMELEQEAFRGASLLLPVDNGQAAILQREFGIEPKRIRVIENAVDIESLGEVRRLNRSEGWTGERYFIVPRRLVPKNGVEVAILGFARLGRDDVKLIIAGDGFLRSSLEKLSWDLGVSSRVKFLGEVARERLLRLIKTSEAVIVPSVPVEGVVEATSLSVLEAMAMEVPIIGSSIGGIKEILANESMGMLIQPGEPEALSRAMAAVLTQDELTRIRMLRNARDRVRYSYGSEVWIRRIKSAYSEAIGNTTITGEGSFTR